MTPALHFYVDDSGTRKLDREPTAFDPARPNHFALGGVLIGEEDEAFVRDEHKKLCDVWEIDYPLHSVDIRHGARDFAWVRRESEDYEDFMSDLSELIALLPITALACVVDRPGYDQRYRALHRGERWHLCRTVFCIAIERAVKHARRLNRVLRVFVEKSSKDDEKKIKGHYQELITTGLPFDSDRSKGYEPLSAQEFNETLIELRFKAKSSPPMQIADLCLWPVAMFRYKKALRTYEKMKEFGKLIECAVASHELETRASKYSCFDLVDRA
jgi:hypothetical protein